MLIYTGGTIGMMMDPDTGLLKPFEFNSLLERMPELRQLNCEIVTRSFDEPIDSSNMTPDHWRELVGIIEENYEATDGFVILHGSDTMAYTASALSFMLEGLSKPVILTGSQLPIGVLRTDARENLITSIELANATDRTGRPRIPEVCVYFEYNLYRGNRVYKYSSQDFEAFNSPNYPLLATAGVNLHVFEEFIRAGSPGPLEVRLSMSDRVSVLPLFPGMPIRMAEKVFEAEDVEAIILQTYGAGNANTTHEFLDLVRSAIESGKIVANISQCRSGGVDQSKYEAGNALRELGVLSGGDMTLEAALTKLMYLLGNVKDRGEVRRLFTTDLRGELTSDQ